jgi:hypothetical protein
VIGSVGSGIASGIGSAAGALGGGGEAATLGELALEAGIFLRRLQQAPPPTGMSRPWLQATKRPSTSPLSLR